MKKTLSVAAATALCLALAVAAHAIDDPRYVLLCAHTVPDGTQLALYGVTDEDRGISDIVAVITKDGAEERTPLMGYDPRYEPELAPAAPTGGAPNEVLLSVFAGGGSGVYIEELYLLRPYVGEGDRCLGVFPFEGDQLARQASELVDMRADGNKVSFVRTSKAGDAGAVIFSGDIDGPIEPDDPDGSVSVFTQQVRYRFGGDGRAVVRISPVLTIEGGMPMYFDEDIEFDVNVTSDADGEISFSLSDPRLAKE